MADETIGIVGAGIVGLATAREIALRRPGTRVVVLEKEHEVAVHQTGHNSGVVHAGIYYAPGSLKADLCVRGVSILREYCQDRGLPYDEIGKLVVAVREDELGRMENLYERARNNHVPELRRISKAEIKELEPHAGGIAALHSPRTAITDYPAIAREFAKDIEASGGEVRLGFPVTSITNLPGGIEVASGQLRVRVDRLILSRASTPTSSPSWRRTSGNRGSSRSGASTCSSSRTAPTSCAGSSTRCPTPLPLPRRALHPARRRHRGGRPERRPRPRARGLQARPPLREGPRRTRRLSRLLEDGRPALAHRHQGVPRLPVRDRLHEGREALRPRSRRLRRRARRGGRPRPGTGPRRHPRGRLPHPPGRSAGSPPSATRPRPPQRPPWRSPSTSSAPCSTPRPHTENALRRAVFRATTACAPGLRKAASPA